MRGLVVAQEVTAQQARERSKARQLKNQRTLDSCWKAPVGAVTAPVAPAVKLAPKAARRVKRLYAGGSQEDGPDA